jgi:hypothetical protein
VAYSISRITVLNFSAVILTCDNAFSLSLGTSISIADIRSTENKACYHTRMSNCSFATPPRGRRGAGLNILRVRSNAWNEHRIPIPPPLSLSQKPLTKVAELATETFGYMFFVCLVLCKLLCRLTNIMYCVTGNLVWAIMVREILTNLKYGDLH